MGIGNNGEVVRCRRERRWDLVEAIVKHAKKGTQAGEAVYCNPCNCYNRKTKNKKTAECNLNSYSI